MGLAELPHDAIDAAALRVALAAGEREGIRTEYKLEVNDGSEWCRDVTALANTSGGVILVGAAETDGLLSDLHGIGGNVDDELLRLDNMLRDLVDLPSRGCV